MREKVGILLYNPLGRDWYIFCNVCAENYIRNAYYTTFTIYNDQIPLGFAQRCFTACGRSVREGSSNLFETGSDIAVSEDLFATRPPERVEWVAPTWSASYTFNTDWVTYRR